MLVGDLRLAVVSRFRLRTVACFFHELTNQNGGERERGRRQLRVGREACGEASITTSEVATASSDFKEAALFRDRLLDHERDFGLGFSSSSSLALCSSA